MEAEDDQTDEVDMFIIDENGFLECMDQQLLAGVVDTKHFEHVERLTSPRWSRLGLDFFSSPGAAARSCSSPVFSISTNPYSQWGNEGTEKEKRRPRANEKEWIANTLCKDPTGNLFYAAAQSLQTYTDPRQQYQNQDGMEKLLLAVVQSVTNEDDGVRILGKQHDSAEVFVLRVAKLLWQTDCTHAVPCKLFVYSVYQGFRVLLLQNAMRHTETFEVLQLAQSILEDMDRKTKSGDFDPDPMQSMKALHQHGMLPDVKWARQLATKCDKVWDTSGYTMDTWPDALERQERLHIMSTEEFGPYSETFATPDAARILSFLVARYVNIFVGQCVQEWEWGNYGRRATTEQEYMDTMKTFTGF